MKHMNKRLKVAAVLMLLTTTNIWASEYTIKGNGLAFAPDVIFAKKGDTILFRQMAAHFVESIKTPDGSEKMLSKMGEDYMYKVTKPGVYFYKCPPHWGARMGGLIVVGDNTNWIKTLESYKKDITDKTSKGFLKKIIKKANKGIIQAPK